MANFDMFDDDDYGDIFITQESRNSGIVSLEDNDEFKSVLDPKYSDISEDEDDGFDGRLK